MFYFGELDREKHSYGFCLDIDSRRDDTFIELTDEEHSKLIDAQNKGKQIVCYDGKVFATDEIDRYYVDDNGKWQIRPKKDYEEGQAEKRKQIFYTHFIKTSLGNYRLEPKGYANAQQAMDVTNTMATALGGLTQQLVPLVIFYETPDFSKAEECTEEWLVAHQKNPSVMTLEEWQKFYFEFCQLYAMQQYKTTA